MKLECSCLYFGLHLFSKKDTYLVRKQLGECRGGGGGVIQSVCLRVQGERDIIPHLYVCTYTVYFHVLPCFLVSCSICRDLTLPSFKKGMFVRNNYFFLQ